MSTAAGLAYREAGPADGPVALLLHGYRQSSYMWRHLLPELAAAGRRAVAPDLAGFGESASDPPGTWERTSRAWKVSGASSESSAAYRSCMAGAG